MPDLGGGRIVAVIPAYEAADRLPVVLDGLRQVLPEAGVVVVDDGSRDGTGDVARQAGADVLRHGRNEGKGRALADGIARALESGAGTILTLDADGQHPPASAAPLLAPIRAGTADVVIGARRRDGGPMPVPRRFSNWLSSTLASRALGVGIPDSQSGFRAFTAEVARSVRPTGARYDFETEFLFLAATAGYRLASVPVPTVYAGEPSHFRYGSDTARLTGVFLRQWQAILFGPRAR